MNQNNCVYNDKVVDDRLTLEEPGTDWIFTCPKIEWIQAAKHENIWAYQFRANMPIDVSKIEGDMWPSYERCKDLSCHAAELSYEFSVEKTLNCPRLSEDKNGMATCQPDGALLKPDMVEMEKMYHAYLANFMHNSDPNNGTGVKISQNMQLVRFSSSDGWTRTVGIELSEKRDKTSYIRTNPFIGKMGKLPVNKRFYAYRLQ